MLEFTQVENPDYEGLWASNKEWVIQQVTVDGVTRFWLCHSSEGGIAHRPSLGEAITLARQLQRALDDELPLFSRADLEQTAKRIIDENRLMDLQGFIDAFINTLAPEYPLTPRSS
jgi:hypothetical protein